MCTAVERYIIMYGLESGIVGVFEFWRLLDIAIYRGIYFNIYSFELGLKWATMGHALGL